MLIALTLGFRMVALTGAACYAAALALAAVVSRQSSVASQSQSSVATTNP